MKELIGFNLVALAITALIVLCTGFKLSTKDKLIFVALEAVFFGILSTGIYLLFS